MLPDDENVVYISQVYDRLQPVCVYMCLLEGAHVSDSKAGCYFGAHGGSSDLKKVDTIELEVVFG